MEDELKEIINKIDRTRQEHERDRYSTYSYILFALALSTVGLSLVTFRHSDAIFFLIFAIVFFAWGLVMRFRARKVKIE
jgi:Flp pilus assembly protein TadB